MLIHYKAFKKFILIIVSLSLIVGLTHFAGFIARAENDNNETLEEIVETVEENTQEPKDYSYLYENECIKIYNLKQLQAIGSHEPVKLTDNYIDTFSQGDILSVNDQVITYSLDAHYILMNNIDLDNENIWSIPDNFTGSFSSIETQNNQELYNQETDTIYIYNNYQLKILLSDNASKEPIMTQDYHASEFGMGQMIYPQDSQDYLTYNHSHHYVLSQFFTSDMPELISNQIKETQSETKAATDGRNFAGQVIWTDDNGKEFILIGNKEQLAVIGSDKIVKTAIYNGTGNMLYGGDADLLKSQNETKDYTFQKDDFSLVKKGVNQKTGNIDATVIDGNSGHKYSRSENYIIFRDIDLSSVDWKPLMFTGTMEGRLNMDASQKVTISNIKVEQTGKLDLKNNIGIGFFGTIASERNDYVSSKGKVTVSNLTLQNVNINNESIEVNTDVTLVGNLLSILNLSEEDITNLATGGFAGRIYGEVVVSNCDVNGLNIANSADITGGFVGSIEGMTRYDAISGITGLITNLLESLLNLVPFLGLGDLIKVLVGGGLLDISKLIPIGYYNPTIDNCSVLLNQGINSNKDYIGGFVGRQVGSFIKNSKVEGRETINGQKYVGGFSGLTANAELEGTLSSLGVELVDAITNQSIIAGCSVNGITSVTSSMTYAGGFVGALADSYAIDCTVNNMNTVKATENYAGGFTGKATLGWAASLLTDDKENKNILLVTIKKLLGSLLTSDFDNNSPLLSLVGISPSVIAGCSVYGNALEISAKNYAGGFIGQGDGVQIYDSTIENVKKLRPIDKNKFQYSPIEKTTNVQNLKTVQVLENYAGGLAGNIVTASIGGILDTTLSMGKYLPFKIENAKVQGISQGYMVKANGNCAGGIVGQATGGDISSVQIAGLSEVSANNYAGGFIGNGGTGSLAEVSGLNILGLVNVSNLLSVADGLILNIKDCTVKGIDNGFTVQATGSRTSDSDITEYFAGGFIGQSKSAHIVNSTVDYLKEVKADNQNGFAGGFVGAARTGGLAEAVGNDTDAIKIIGINGLLNGVPYLIPKFKNTTVQFVTNGGVQVSGNYAGGFIGELQSGDIDNTDINTNTPAITGIENVQGRLYAGGFVGKAYAGGLVESNGLSILNGILNINIGNLLSVLNVYIPVIKFADVSSNGLKVEATSIESTDINSSSAGGYIGYGSGVKISDSDVSQLAYTKVIPPTNLNSVEANTYFNNQSDYAVKSQRYAGGYAGKIDIGNTASLGGGLSLLSGLELANVLEALAVVNSTIEDSNVTGGAGGYSVLANGNLSSDIIGHAGGFVGAISGSQIKNSNAYNFAYIIAQESAGGYVGTMQPGNVASVLGKTDILSGLLTSDNLASLLQTFIPMIYNSETTCIPCGGAVRAQSVSDNVRARGLAGGYVGYNLGGRIEGKKSDISGSKDCSVYRLRSVYGYEYAGGFSGRMECANVADTGSLNVLYDLIKLSNPLKALSAVYPTQDNTAIYGPLRGLTTTQWNTWVEHVGVNNSYGEQLKELGEINDENQLKDIIEKYAYGYDISTGRSEVGSLSTQGGSAGGYTGRMDGGVITTAHAIDLKSVEALRSSGGFVGEMMSASVANAGGIQLADIDIVGELPVLETFVPVIKTSSIAGYQSGAIVKSTGDDLKNRQGNAGGFAGIIVGGQIEGTNDNYCSINKLRSVIGKNNIGGFAGIIMPGSALNLDTQSQSGLLSELLNYLIQTPTSLAKVLNSTISKINYAQVNAWNHWGISLNGAYTKEGSDNTQYAYTAGGFVGNVSGAIIGDNGKDVTEDTIKAINIRSVIGGEHVGGFFGLADVSSVAQVGNDSTSILEIIKLGQVDVLDTFRTYIYHSQVTGSVDNGLVVSAHQQKSTGTLNSTVWSGNAGGFGGSLLDGSVKNSSVTQLNKVSALNYSGGFIGHMGKSGVVDLDKVDAIAKLLNATAGVLDVFGSNSDECSVTGMDIGYIVESQGGNEPISGGFVGYGDLARIDQGHVLNIKKVYSDEIAGGFMGKTSFAYLADINAGSDALLDPVLSIVNALLDYLYIDNLQNLNPIDINLGSLLQLSVLNEGNVLSVTLLGLKISVGLVKNNGDGTSDLAQIHIGDSYIEVPCTDIKGNHISEKDKENIKIGLIKANRTKIANSTIQGIQNGYDVFAGGANDQEDGNTNKGIAGGFIGLNNEGLLENNEMSYADVIRGTTNLVGPFVGKSSLDSQYNFNTTDNIEGQNNIYHIYRTLSAFVEIITKDNKSIKAVKQDKWNDFSISHIKDINNFKDLEDVKLATEDKTDEADLQAYVSPTKAVLMNDVKTSDNTSDLTPPPSDIQDPCREFVFITINKVWKDFNNLDGKRPVSITITLHRSYKDENGQVVTETVDNYINDSISSTGNTWQKIITDLPAYKTVNNDKAYYTYFVTEDEVAEYTTEIKDVSDDKTITITNSHTPFLPETGGKGIMMFMLIGSLGILLTLLTFKKKRGKTQ
ncbi:MAG: Cna B-type domain-containing protein [Longibaculum sp.]